MTLVTESPSQVLSAWIFNLFQSPSCEHASPLLPSIQSYWNAYHSDIWSLASGVNCWLIRLLESETSRGVSAPTPAHQSSAKQRTDKERRQCCWLQRRTAGLPWDGLSALPAFLSSALRDWGNLAGPHRISWPCSVQICYSFLPTCHVITAREESPALKWWQLNEGLTGPGVLTAAVWGRRASVGCQSRVWPYRERASSPGSAYFRAWGRVLPWKVQETFLKTFSECHFGCISLEKSVAASLKTLIAPVDFCYLDDYS